MASFVIMESPLDRAEQEPLIVRDGFSWLGLLLPLFWLLWHRLWIEALLAFALLMGLGLLAEAGGFAAAGPALTVLVGLYVGIDGAALRLGALRRRGWREWGAIEAENRDDAETRYALAVGDDGEPDYSPREIVAGERGANAAAPGPVLGLIGYADGR